MCAELPNDDDRRRQEGIERFIASQDEESKRSVHRIVAIVATLVVVLLAIALVVGRKTEDPSRQVVDSYLADLSANGYGSLFASDRVAVLYAQHFCESYAAGRLSPDPTVDRVLVRWCESDALMKFDAQRISD